MGGVTSSRPGRQIACINKREREQKWQDTALEIIGLLNEKKPLSKHQKEFCSSNFGRLKRNTESFSETEHVLLARVGALRARREMNTSSRQADALMPLHDEPAGRPCAELQPKNAGPAVPGIAKAFPEYANLVTALDGFMELAKIIGGGDLAAGQSYIKRDSGIYEARALAQWRDGVTMAARQGTLPPQIKAYFVERGFRFEE